MKKIGDEYELRIPEWNITKVMAESCWDIGYNGNCIIIGHLSSGCAVSHPALTGKWLLPYWVDPVYGGSQPYDDLGPGTHAIGVICGGDGFGPFVDDIGIACGSRFIPAKCTNNQGAAQYYWIDSCMQYLANLKQSGVDIRVISNCWSAAKGSDLHWWNLILNWKNLGVLPVYPVGGGGPSAGTVGSHASYPTVIGVGPLISGDNIANFSSRGPAPNINPINDPSYWYYPSWNLLKPDISAPGVSIRSSVPNGGYATYSSTARATPHISGAVAILLQKNPNLTVIELYDLLRNNCDQPGQVRCILIITMVGED
ncbi:MAG: S8 family serine peptidase [candidate division WOR-3 bacterium]|nr:S8 family serine peptidase [candidate division WOR-3 bacterium]